MLTHQDKLTVAWGGVPQRCLLLLYTKRQEAFSVLYRLQLGVAGVGDSRDLAIFQTPFPSGNPLWRRDPCCVRPTFFNSFPPVNRSRCAVFTVHERGHSEDVHWTGPFQDHSEDPFLLDHIGTKKTTILGKSRYTQQPELHVWQVMWWMRRA